MWTVDCSHMWTVDCSYICGLAFLLKVSVVVCVHLNEPPTVQQERCLQAPFRFRGWESENVTQNIFWIAG